MKTLKVEGAYPPASETAEDVAAQFPAFIATYDARRLHPSPGYLSPNRTKRSTPGRRSKTPPDNLRPEGHTPPDGRFRPVPATVLPRPVRRQVPPQASHLVSCQVSNPVGGPAGRLRRLAGRAGGACGLELSAGRAGVSGLDWLTGFGEPARSPLASAAAAPAGRPVPWRVPVLASRRVPGSKAWNPPRRSLPRVAAILARPGPRKA